MTRILVVEDDVELRGLLVRNLQGEGFCPEGAEDGRSALALHRARRADLMVLDLVLPGLDGLQVLKALREAGDPVPVILLTAKGEESDRVAGLRSGADDYLVKPFSLLELIARIPAVLRRVDGTAAPRRLRSGPFLFDLVSLAAERDGEALDLSPREFRILEVLLMNAGRTLSRLELLELAWEPGARPSAKTINVHIANLRRKMGTEGRYDAITTVGGEGYRWTESVEPVG